MFDTFIYCCGKSGSTTLTDTFKNNGYKVIKIHREEYYNDVHKDKYKMPMYKLINLSRKEKNIAFIDVYRLPIERKISSFFQNINLHIPDYETKSIQELIDLFNSKYLYELEEYHSINEVMGHYHVPLFEQFNFKKRYVMKTHENMIFIKLHFNDISKWNQILSSITGKKIMMKSNNISSEKYYKDIYKQFKDQYKLPIDYLLIIENNNEFKIFNTPTEQINYLSMWKLKSI